MYQDSYIKNHMDASGTRYFDGEIWSRGVVERIDYGLTDKLALDLSLPLIYSKYKGNDPEGNPPPGIDNGRFNGAFTDFRFDLRYNVRSHPLTLTPFIGTVVPSHNYQFFAHSAPGQRLHALVFGIAAGRRLDPVLPRAYFQTQYSFSLTLQHIFGYRPSHSQLDSEFGYFLTKRLTLVAVEDLLLTHGGIYDPLLTDQNFDVHDQILNMAHLEVGPGAGYELTPTFNVYGAVATTVWGHDTHALHRAFVIGMNWSFRTRLAAPRVSESIRPVPNQGQGLTGQSKATLQ